MNVAYSKLIPMITPKTTKQVTVRNIEPVVAYMTKTEEKAMIITTKKITTIITITILKIITQHYYRNICANDSHVLYMV
jgi:hypothetical protein